MNDKFIVVHIVPTGIGAEIGGYAGDATQANNLLASVSDLVITHPNVVNAANFYLAKENVLYVEGYCLDQFMSGNLALEPVLKNRIGIVIDRAGIDHMTHIENAINATISTAGVNVVGYTITEEAIGAKVIESKEGHFSGEIGNPDTLLKASQRLIDRKSQAIAIFAVIDDIPEQAEQKYLSGEGSDPIGAVEALISRLVSWKFNIPAAHAPIYPIEYEREIVNPRAAAEEIGFTFIPCVLMGLSKSPQIIKKSKEKLSGITYQNVGAMVIPDNSPGGISILSALEADIPVISVRENLTNLRINSIQLGKERVIKVENYFEAVGMLVAIRQGINWKVIRRPLDKVKEI